MKAQRVVLASFLFSVAGCMPVYRPLPDQPLADVVLSPSMNNSELEMCDLGKCYEVKPLNNHVRVPAGRRISLYKVISGGGYQFYYSCVPSLSFIAAMDVHYYVDLSMRAEHCQLSVFRLAPASRVGIDFDPSVRPFH